MNRTTIAAIESEFLRYRGLAEETFRQLDASELTRGIQRIQGIQGVEVGHGAGNSVAILVWHISGNLRSRFTDFLTSDGEKAWRQRDSEFEPREVDHRELQATWEEGWRVLRDALATLSDDDLGRTVTIRGVPHSVLQALLRALAHLSYHVGQIVYLGKLFRGDAWETLSIPRGGSEDYNRNPIRERHPGEQG